MRDMLPFIACAGIAALMAGLMARDIWRERQAWGVAVHRMVLPVPAAALLAGRHGFRGRPSAPYTLVEFGDYECSPCRRSQEPLRALLANHQGRLRLDFRQNPLVAIHRHAREAALAAESARAAERFWPVHDAVFGTDLSRRGAVADVLRRAAVVPNTIKAQRQLRADGALARRLGVDGTPTFVLCRPDGRVLRLRDLEDVDRLVE